MAQAASCFIPIVNHAECSCLNKFMLSSSVANLASLNIVETPGGYQSGDTNGQHRLFVVPLGGDFN